MQPQQIEGPRAQTILVVDSDEVDAPNPRSQLAARRLRGARREQRRGGRQAPRRSSRSVIVAADDPEGLDFCRRAKQADAMAPAVVLMFDPNVENKRRGLEAGADDFVARPIYVQEVVARTRALLQTTRSRAARAVGARERALRRAPSRTFRSSTCCARSPRTRSRASRVVMGGEGARGELYFRQGRVVDAEVGRLSGRDAVYRLFCWSSGTLDRRVEEHPPQGHDRDRRRTTS